MITAQHIKERLEAEKYPLQYIDDEISRRVNLMGGRCENVQDIIAIYNHRENKDEQFDLQPVKEEFKNIGELYIEINLFQKARKAQVKQQKRNERLNKAQAKHQIWIEQKNKRTPNE
jgi:GT2 family glycosyltransferase